MNVNELQKLKIQELTELAGKLNIEGQTYTTVSLSSPLGEELEGCGPGETVSFRGKTLKIIAIL